MRSYGLMVVGAGSGNMLFGPEFGDLKCAIIEPDRFGGTCLNRGCIPSKMLVVAADAARGPGQASRLGVHATLDRVDWPAIRDRVFGRIDPISTRPSITAATTASTCTPRRPGSWRRGWSRLAVSS